MGGAWAVPIVPQRDAGIDDAGRAAQHVAPHSAKESPMEPFKTHGAFSWSELMTSDPKAACEFYGTLFGWKVETMDMGSGSYHVVKVGDAAVGGIMGKPPGVPASMPSVWGCYVTVQNVDETLAKVKSLGGTVCMEPMDIKGVGRMAVIQDPQGAMLNVIAYSM
jgi:uncharacterized protein